MSDFDDVVRRARAITESDASRRRQDNAQATQRSAEARRREEFEVSNGFAVQEMIDAFVEYASNHQILGTYHIGFSSGWFIETRAGEIMSDRHSTPKTHVYLSTTGKLHLVQYSERLFGNAFLPTKYKIIQRNYPPGECSLVRVKQALADIIAHPRF